VGGAFRKLYTTLTNASELVRKKQTAKFKDGPFSLAAVGISEALRFGEFQVWVVNILADGGYGEFVPERYHGHFNDWSDDSVLVFKPDTPIDILTRISILKIRHGVNLPLRRPHEEPEASSGDD
jgi:hypothetical protein